MARRAKCAAIALSLTGLAASAAAEPASAPAHYLALRTDHVDGRRGPSEQHPVEWVYQRRGLPMRVVEQNGAWRRVEDPGGARVWIRLGDLEDRRTVYVRGDRLPTSALRQGASEDSRTQAYVERGVVGQLEECRGAWRLVAVGDRRGWMEADALWGGDAC